MTVITDKHVATLRAIIDEDRAEHERLMRELGAEGAREGYFRLLLGAFNEAVTMRFRGKNYHDVVNWIAETRTQWTDDAPIDPDVAERVILWVFGKGTTDGLDFQTESLHETIIMLVILEEMQLDDAAIKEFLQKSRHLADSASGSV